MFISICRGHKSTPTEHSFTAVTCPYPLAARSARPARTKWERPGFPPEYSQGRCQMKNGPCKMVSACEKHPTQLGSSEVPTTTTAMPRSKHLREKAANFQGWCNLCSRMLHTSSSNDCISGPRPRTSKHIGQKGPNHFCETGGNHTHRNIIY